MGGLVELRGCLGYLEWCNEDEAGEEEAPLLFGVTRASSAWVFPIRHQPSPTVQWPRQAQLARRTIDCDPAAGHQRGALAPPGSFSSLKTSVNSM